MTPDIIEVIAGQDRGARFSLMPGSSTLGRSGKMDVVLTDPALQRLHARFFLSPDILTIQDLSGGATVVNGLPAAEPVRLAVGDRIALGATELSVVWSPGTPLPAPGAASSGAAPPPRPAPEPAAVGRGSPEPHDSAAREVPALLTAVPAAGVAVALAILALVATWLPFLTRPDGGVDTLWSVAPSGLAAQALGVSVVASAAAGWWLVSALSDAGTQHRLPALATTLSGAAIVGLPLFALAVPLGGGSHDVGVFVLLVAGLGSVAVGAVGIAGSGIAYPAGGPHAGSIIGGVGAGLGGLLAAISAPLPWLAGNLTEVSGLDPALRAGRLTLPLGLLTAFAATGAVLAPLLARRPLELPLLLAAAVLGVAGATLTLATAIAFASLDAEPGLLTTLVGTSVAGSAAGAGVLWMLVDGSRPRRPGEPG